jgi:hypothetical protein
MADRLGKRNTEAMGIIFLLRRLFPRDFKPVGAPIASPDGKLLAVPMINYCIADRSLGRFVTLDVRNSRYEFMHCIQSGVAASERWAISWRDNNTVVVSGSRSGEWAYGVGIDSLYYPQRLPPYPGWLPAEVVSN